ncbi:MAG: IS66 family insertion sequence element accessory protein TnpA [Roseburia intestinalis]
MLQCRTSGLSDRQWLEENNVSSPTFYYHLKQLRKKACEIPASTFSSTSTDYSGAL